MTLRLLVFAFLFSIVTGVHAQPTEPVVGDCAPIKNMDALLQPGAVVLLGEMHGTNESPRFLSQTLCLALKQGHAVTVGLEFPNDETPLVQAYLNSSGDPQDTARLLTGAFWLRSYQDGRSSQAMLDVIENLRGLRASGAPVRAILIDDPSAAKRDSVMAHHLSHAIETSPTDVFLVLTGNVHNRLTVGTHWDASYEPMGYRLSQTLRNHSLYALNVSYSDGEAWVCFGSSASDCGVQPLHGKAEEGDGVVLVTAPENAAYSGRYFVGPLSASHPAVKPKRDQ